MPSAIASTERVNSSREPVRATSWRSHGTTRVPTTTTSATNRTTLQAVRARAAATLPLESWAPRPRASPPRAPASAGRSTRASTITRSSTISHPIAIRPLTASSPLRCSSARNSTTVLATDSASPSTRPAPKPQPQSSASATPHAVATAICAMAPGSAMARTASRSLMEKCRPTPNIRRMTPISASWLARLASPTNPGVNGPSTTPARR